jgi:hypothetical protein
MKGIAGRIARLESYRRPRSSYVLHLSTCGTRLSRLSDAWSQRWRADRRA